MKPIILAILDGWGIGPESQTNAIYEAKTPHLDEVKKNYPHCALQSSAMAVGLPWKEAGNSEAGHLTIGSGRIIYQHLPRISMDIENENFFRNPALLKIIEHAKTNQSVLHLMGLISSGNVHSYLEHVYGLLELARRNQIANLRLHLFTDGKDAPMREGVKIISTLIEKLKNPNWKIASIIGRFYAMDRNHNWDRTEITYNLIVNGIGEKTQNPIDIIKKNYDNDIIDTHIKPIVIVNEGQNPIGEINDNDAIIFWNFREDSIRQLAEAFAKKDFDKFPIKKLNNVLYCAMTDYEDGLDLEVAYPAIKIKNHLTEILNNNNKKILKIAETEKYAHVTYFFNGGRELSYPQETRKLIASKIVTHYEQSPEMQAEKITTAIISGIESKFDLIVANYSNADMIGHTGNFKAAVKAVQFVDKAIAPLINLAKEGECILIITSDHGNAEQMIDPQTGEAKTEHTLDPVPFYLIDKKLKLNKNSREYSFEPAEGMLSDIAPTILALMQIPQPPEMTGTSLLDVLK